MTTPPSQMPDGLELARTTPEFTAESVPPALLATHTVAAGVWGRIRVRAGTVRFVFEDADGSGTHTLEAGDHLDIAPERPHHVEPDGEARFVVEFHRPPA